VPGSAVLLNGSREISQLMLSDMLGHTGRIWDHAIGWSSGNAWAVPIHSRRESMLARYQAWKKVDKLVCLPPPP